MRSRWHFCAISVHFFQLGVSGALCKLWCGPPQGCPCCRVVSHKAAFLRERCEEVLESAKAEGGLLEEESGREPSWAPSHPCCLLSEGRVTSCPLGKARKRTGEQRSNSQVSSLVSFHLAVCIYGAQITNRLNFTSSALHFHKFNGLLQIAHV